jgi:hypothetical protein
MTDLGRLFRLIGSGPKPLENFTTVALAIAIGHDDRPMRRALGSVERACEESLGIHRPCGPPCASGHPHWAISAFTTAVAESVSLTAETQKTLWGDEGIRSGYLDLALTARDAVGLALEIWVEVEVDAWESGDQLEVYRRHAERRSPPPVVITLGRTHVKPCVPFLKWSHVVDGIDSVHGPHYTWQSLRDFLLDEQIVRLPVEAADPEACM